MSIQSIVLKKMDFIARVEVVLTQIAALYKGIMCKLYTYCVWKIYKLGDFVVHSFMLFRNDYSITLRITGPPATTNAVSFAMIKDILLFQYHL